MTSPATLLKAWNIRARKALGQNFLIHPAIALQIVSQAQIKSDEVVLEIGAGLGVVTVAAASCARKVIAVEIDRQLIPLLRSELLLHGAESVEIREQDILSMDLEQLATEEKYPLVVLGNLPYYISSQVMVKLIKARLSIDRAVLMFQKELAERLCARPGSRAYGRLSVLLQYCADLKRLNDVKAAHFFPKPKVDSAVVRIDFKRAIDPAVDDELLFQRVIQAAFGQRRKTLRNALASGLLPLDTQASEKLLQQTGIDSRRRAETLSVNEYVALTNRLAGME